MNGWLDDIDSVDHDNCIIVTVARVRGSAPRETGAKMIVTKNETVGTIGGGQLEYQCTRIAVRMLLREGDYAGERLWRRFPLGANCGQCCGGVVDVVFERVVRGPRGWLAELKRLHVERWPAVLVTKIDGLSVPQLVTAQRRVPTASLEELPVTVIAAARKLIADHGRAFVLDGFLLEPVLPTNFNVAVFGAGHVGTATVAVLSRLDCRIRWIDSRRNIFPANLSGNVSTVESGRPADEVAAMPPGSCYLVVTHSHPLDFEICSQVLQRGDAAYCGLIGSAAKRRRFERNLRKQGTPDTVLDRLTCPIGVSGISGRKPVEIAIAVAAELLQIRDAAGAANQDNGDAPENSNVNVHVL